MSLTSVLVACALCALGCGDDSAAAAVGRRDAGPDDLYGNIKDGSIRILTAQDGGGAAAVCGAEPFDAAQAQVNLLLVIDKSGSMKDTPDGFSTNKWSAMKDSLAAALDPVKDDLWLGVQLYPSSACSVPDDDAAEVDVQVGGNALPRVQEALAAAEPSGGTPTAAALTRALRYFTTGAGAQLAGARYVLLATDGGPNCNEANSCEQNACTVNLDAQCPMGVANCCDESLAGAGAQLGCLDDVATRDAVRALALADIPTFVVGIPGTENYASLLDDLALAGGRPSTSGPERYYAVSAAGSDSGGLTSVLRTITSSLIMTCRLQLGSVPPDLDKLNVRVDDKLVPKDGENGWALDTLTDPPTIELKGSTCERIEREGAESVTVLFGCPTFVM